MGVWALHEIAALLDQSRIVVRVLLILVILGLVYAVWFAPAWSVPWVFGFCILLWAYHCIVKVGYPLLPTVAWVLPLTVVTQAGFFVDAPWGLIATCLGLGAMWTLYVYEPAQRLWYTRLFGWRP